MKPPRGDCGHNYARHIPPAPTSSCTGTRLPRGVFHVTCPCRGWHDTTPATGRDELEEAA